MLLLAKQAGLVAHLRPLLDEMRERHGFRLADALYDRLVAQAGE